MWPRARGVWRGPPGIHAQRVHYNRMIKSKTSLASLASLVAAIGGDLNYVNTATGIRQLAWLFERKARHSGGDFGGGTLEEQRYFRAGFRAEHADPSAVWEAPAPRRLPSTPQRAFLKSLDMPDHEKERVAACMHTLVARFWAQPQDFTPWELTNIVWALAKMTYVNDELLAYACVRVRDAKSADVAPLAAVSLLWSIAVLTQTRSAVPVAHALAPQLLVKATRHIDELTTQGVANVTWAANRLNILDDDSVAVLARRAVALGPEFLGLELGMLALALVVWRDVPAVSDAYNALAPHAEHAIRNADARRSDFAHTVSAIIYGYRTVAFAVELPEEDADLEVFPGVSDALLARISCLRSARVNPISLPALAWGMAHARIYDEALLASLLRLVVSNLHARGALIATEPSTWLWALAKLDVPLPDAARRVIRAAVLEMYGSEHLERCSVARHGGPGQKLLLPAAPVLKQWVGTAWALAIMDLYDKRMRSMLADNMERLLADAGIDPAALRSAAHMRLVHQLVYSEMLYHVSAAAVRGGSLGAGGLMRRLKEDSVVSDPLREALITSVRRTVQAKAREPISKFHISVVASLRRLGWDPHVEHITRDGLFSIDVALQASSRGRHVRIALEVDGPSHFTINRPWRMMGESLARQRIIAALGWVVVSVPFHEWFSREGHGERDAWLRRTLEAACRGA